MELKALVAAVASAALFTHVRERKFSDAVTMGAEQEERQDCIRRSIATALRGQVVNTPFQVNWKEGDPIITVTEKGCPDELNPLIKVTVDFLRQRPIEIVFQGMYPLYCEPDEVNVQFWILRLTERVRDSTYAHSIAS